MSEDQKQQAMQATASESEQGGAYGYSSDEVKVSPFVFGGNFGNTFLKKFEWIPNGGKDGAEQEAIDIVFEINGTEKSYRVFPITQAFKKDSQEIVTDKNAPEFKEAVMDLNSRMVHILHCFSDEPTIKSALARPIKSFKEFAGILASLLPKDFDKKPLDIFLQFQWQLKEGQKRTYLDIPTKMKYGRWVCPAQPGNWEKHTVENPTESIKEALWYTNEQGTKHPFFRNGWFMASNFAKQQRADGEEEGTESTNTDTAASETTQAAPGTAAKASTW